MAGVARCGVIRFIIAVRSWSLTTRSGLRVSGRVLIGQFELKRWLMLLAGQLVLQSTGEISGLIEPFPQRVAIRSIRLAGSKFLSQLSHSCVVSIDFSVWLSG